MKKIIAFTDQVTQCECCGKSGLKGTFCVEIDGIEVYYGSTCAHKKHGLNKDILNVAKAPKGLYNQLAFIQDVEHIRLINIINTSPLFSPERSEAIIKNKALRETYKY